jgi:multimeric flavodoxin WrbA
MNKTIIISGSVRKNRTGANISKLFQKELKDKSVIFSLAEKKVGFCTSCLVCDKSRSKNCPINDDFQIFISEVKDCKNIIFVAPIYEGDISGAVKNFIDRTNHYCNFDKWKGKKIFLILTGCLTKDEDKKPIKRIKEFFKEYTEITCCDFEYLGFYTIDADKGDILKDCPEIHEDVKSYCKKLI